MTCGICNDQADAYQGTSYRLTPDPALSQPPSLDQICTTLQEGNYQTELIDDMLYVVAFTDGSVFEPTSRRFAYGLGCFLRSAVAL